MDSLFFWQRWHPVSRRVYWALLALLAVTMLWFGFSYFRGIENVIDWERISEVETVSLPVDEVSVGVFDFSYSADHYVIRESYRGGNIRIDPTVAYLLLAALALTLIFLFVIVSTFNGFWFYFGGLLLIALMLGMRWEQLQLFGSTGRLGFGLVMALYLPLTFYFQKIRPDFGLLPRLLAFTGATLILAVVVHFFAEVAYPALHLISFGLVVPIALSLFFVILVAHEIISFFLKLITQNNSPTSKHSFFHFAAISIVYLVNLTLLVLRNIQIIDWDILYLNAFLLLAIGTMVGIWGFRDREVQYQYIVGFQPLGAYLYLALAVLTFATLGFFTATANDPVLETFEDTIIYSQVGFGLIFLVYVIANFIQELADNQRVYRIVYRPPNLPYGTMQIVGLVATIAFFARAGLFPFYQAVAGYHNTIGDLYQYQDDLFLAEQHYKLGDQYGYKNHRSNYALGALARRQRDPALTTFYFNEAVQKNPTPQAYVNLANAFLETNQFFEGVFAFRQGLSVFPGNAYLQNNLALAFGKTSVLDSALYYLQQAQTNRATKAPAEANTLGVLATSKTAISVDMDTLLSETVTDTTYLPVRVNALSLQQRYDNQRAADDLFSEDESTDSTLNSLRFAHLYNSLLMPANAPDTTLTHYAQAVSQRGSQVYDEPLSFASAVALYRANRVVEALKIVDRLQAVNIFKKGYYLHTMGLWTLEQNAPAIAADYFGRAAEARYSEAAFKQAVSYSEAAARPFGNPSVAIAAWDSLLTDSVAVSAGGVSTVAKDMLTIFSEEALATAVDTATDVFLYQALRYRYPELSSDQREAVWQAFDDSNYQAIAVHDLWLRFPTHRNEAWNQWANEVAEADGLSQEGQTYTRWIAAFRAEQQQDWTTLTSLVDELRPMGRWHQYWLTYFRARLAQRAGEEQAAYYYAALAHNPFFSQGFLAALAYLYPSETDQTEAYGLLLDATQTNPYDAALLRAYVLAALRANLETYAEEGLQDYQAMVSSAEYQAFRIEYDSVRAAQVIDF